VQGESALLLKAVGSVLDSGAASVGSRICKVEEEPRRPCGISAGAITPSGPERTGDRKSHFRHDPVTDTCRLPRYDRLGEEVGRTELQDQGADAHALNVAAGYERTKPPFCEGARAAALSRLGP